MKKAAPSNQEDTAQNFYKHFRINLCLSYYNSL
nr:MAG TPA: hypothetical protein [Caudoviricetes sp.]